MVSTCMGYTAIHTVVAVIAYTSAIVGHIYEVKRGQALKQASKKTDFTVDLIWWGSLRLAPTN